jgi:hypothetical protein
MSKHHHRLLLPCRSASALPLLMVAALLLPLLLLQGTTRNSGGVDAFRIGGASSGSGRGGVRRRWGVRVSVPAAAARQGQEQGEEEEGEGGQGWRGRRAVGAATTAAGARAGRAVSSSSLSLLRQVRISLRWLDFVCLLEQQQQQVVTDASIPHCVRDSIHRPTDPLVNPQPHTHQQLPFPSSTKVITSLLGLTFGLRPLLAPPMPAYAAAEQQQAASVVAPGATEGGKGACGGGVCGVCWVGLE